MNNVIENELREVCKLTGAKPNQIKIHTNGYWSRAYVINNGEYVVKFATRDFKKSFGFNEVCDYEKEARILTELNKLNLPVKLQKVIKCDTKKRFLFMNGVVGTPLSEITSITETQKQDIGIKLGHFIKELHSLKLEYSGRSLTNELTEYQSVYTDLQPIYEKYLSKTEHRLLNYLAFEVLPNTRRDLGEKKVFTHADLFDRHLLINNNDIGVIDFGNAGLCDEATDFVSDVEQIRLKSLESYNADSNLRKKVQLSHDMSVLSALKFYIPIKGEKTSTKLWIPRVKSILAKYQNDKSLDIT